MIEAPNLWFFISIMLIPIIIGLIILIKRSDFIFGFGSAMVGLTIFILLAIFWLNPINERYFAEVTELIDTTNCDKISGLADEYPVFKKQVVDEVILRCLNDNPELKSFVLEGKQ